MIEVSKTRYDVIAITEKGVQLKITQVIEGLGWEEGKDELAMKISFKMYNAKYNNQLLSTLIKIGCVVAIKAYWSDGNGIVAMGNITECERTTSKSDEIYNVSAYDNLYNLQRSQDNIYFAAGKSTSSALGSVFGAWGISLSSYSGPNVTHAKILYKNAYLGDVIRGILDEAKKKGGCRAIARSTEGKISIVKIGSNKDIYHFEGDDTTEATYRISIANIVTRVKIVGSEKEEGCPEVEATVDGNTKYGIFQRIVNHSSSDSIADAKQTASEMINEDGKPEETSKVISPDVPPLRKGDMVHMQVGALNGFFIAISVQHNADSGKMTMELEKCTDKGGSSGSGQEQEKKEKDYEVGDIVNFHGGTHYISSYPDAAGYQVSAGRARIEKKDGSGKAHPWCLVTEDWNQTHVWGWVDDGTFD